MVYWYPAVATSESVLYPFPTCKLWENFGLNTFTSDTETHTSFFVPQLFCVVPHSVPPSFLDSKKRSWFSLRTTGFLSPFSLHSGDNFHSLTYMAEKLLLFVPSFSAMSKSDTVKNYRSHTTAELIWYTVAYPPLPLFHIPCKGSLGS